MRISGSLFTPIPVHVGTACTLGKGDVDNRALVIEHICPMHVSYFFHHETSRSL
jgi:hypothetical protein